MKTLVIHVILASVLSYQLLVNTAAVPNNATTAGLAFVLAYLLLWLSSYLYHRSYFHKLPKAVSFLAYLLKELFIANIKVALDIITPGYKMRPTVLAVPLTVKTDLEITWLSCLITLTPGTLVLDVSEDKRTLYVHALYFTDNETAKFKEQLKNGFERRIIELTA